MIAAAETSLHALQEIADVETAEIPDDEAWFQRSRDAYVILRPQRMVITKAALDWLKNNAAQEKNGDGQ